MSLLPPQVAAWVEEALGREAWIVDMGGVTGAHLNAVHTVDAMVGRAGVVPFIVKRFPDESREEQQRAVERESTHLELLAATAVPAPRLIAVDVTGEQAGEPAVLMERMPGAVVLDPADRLPWLRSMAALLPTVHAVEVPTEVEVRPFFVYTNVAELDLPIWTADPALWDFVLATAGGRAPAVSQGFIHRDFHPGNMLWRTGGLSALIDWEPASIGPLAMDLAHCRLNVAQLHGAAAADELLDAYGSVVGSTEHDPYFDLLAVVETLPQAAPPYGGSPTENRAKLETYVRSVVRRF